MDTYNLFVDVDVESSMLKVIVFFLLISQELIN